MDTQYNKLTWPDPAPTWHWLPHIRQPLTNSLDIGEMTNVVEVDII